MKEAIIAFLAIAALCLVVAAGVGVILLIFWALGHNPEEEETNNNNL